MDMFIAGSVKSYISAADAQKTWEIKRENGCFKPDDTEKERRYDHSDIKRDTAPEFPRVSILTGSEKTLYDKLKEELERLQSKCSKCDENQKENNTDDPENQAGEKELGEWLEEQAKLYEDVPDDPKKSISDWVKEQMKLWEENNAKREEQKRSDTQLQNINSKLNMGQKLTPTEKQYLAAHDPTAYQNAQRIESERNYYAKMLNCCRTQDDVHALRLSNAVSALQELKKIRSGGGDAMSSLSLIMQRNAAFESETNRFVRSGGFSALPTRAECRKVAADLRKAKRYEMEKKRAKALERKRTAEAKRKAKRLKKNPGDGKRTVAQVMQSPTAKKVRRSMAKRAYLCSAQAAFHVVSKMNRKG